MGNHSLPYGVELDRIKISAVGNRLWIGSHRVHRFPPANAAALPFAVTPGIETPVRATKSDRLNVRPEIRKIAGVTVVLRDFDSIIR